MPGLGIDNLSDSVAIILQSLHDSKLDNDFQPDETDFLMKFLQTKSCGKLLQVHMMLEETLVRPDEQDNIVLCKEILTMFDKISGHDAHVRELAEILDRPHLRSLIEAHDNVLYKTYATPQPSPSISPAHQSGRSRAEPIRVIGLHRTCSEPLGITLSVDKFGSVYIARILRGSMIDRQGLLHVGDVIKEVNGKPVSGSPDAVHNELKNHVGSISLKLYPSYKDTSGLCQIFVKAHFDFDASRDQHIPCGEAGLSFRKGDILEVVEQSDPNWWQARAVDGSCQAGIIPSQMLEENRRTLITSSHRESRVHLCGTTRTKKRKVVYSSAKNAAFDRLDIPVYEEVARMPPFQRKTLVLIGAPRVGRRMLKNRLIVEEPARFASTIPHTSRPSRAGEESGRGYHFVSRAQMLQDIEDGKFLEWDEFERHLYGTKIETVRSVMRSGKMCILDVNPTALKILKTAEFMPLVVFIAAPSADVLRETNRKSAMGKASIETDLQETLEENRHLSELYSHYFDLAFVNEDCDVTLCRLKSAIEALNTQTQWVPVNWVY